MLSLLAREGVLLRSPKAFVTKIPFPVSIMLYRGGALHFGNTVNAATRFFPSLQGLPRVRDPVRTCSRRKDVQNTN